MGAFKEFYLNESNFDPRDMGNPVIAKLRKQKSIVLGLKYTAFGMYKDKQGNVYYWDDDKYNFIKKSKNESLEESKDGDLNESKVVLDKDNPKLTGYGDWVGGKIGNYKFNAKIFATGSQFGIDKGRISKLQVWDVRNGSAGKWVFHYDRGWDMEPKTDEHKEILKSIVKHFK